MTNEVKLYQLGYLVGTALLKAKFFSNQIHISDSELEKALSLIEEIRNEDIIEEISKNVFDTTARLGTHRGYASVIYPLKEFYDKIREIKNEKKT